MGNLWHYETHQVRVPESVQEAAPRFSHFSSHFMGDFFSSHSCRACPQHWVELSLKHVSDMALLLTNHPENLGVPPWRFGCRKNMPPGDQSHAEPVTNWPFAATSGDVTLSEAPERCHGTTPMRQAHPTGTKSLLPWDRSSGDAPLPNSYVFYVFGHTTTHFPDFLGWVELSPLLLVGQKAPGELLAQAEPHKGCLFRQTPRDELLQCVRPHLHSMASHCPLSAQGSAIHLLPNR